MELSRPPLVVAFELSEKPKAIVADALASASAVVYLTELDEAARAEALRNIAFGDLCRNNGAKPSVLTAVLLSKMKERLNHALESGSRGSLAMPIGSSDLSATPGRRRDVLRVMSAGH